MNGAPKGCRNLAEHGLNVLALTAGGVQAFLVPDVVDAHGARIYFAIWLVCCAASIIVNYGAIAHWFVSDVSARDRWQTRTVGLSILPALVMGAALSAMLLRLGHVELLPGTWYSCYGVGLCASRTMIPRSVVPIAMAFVIAGCALFFAPPEIALQWWVMPIGFGAMQLFIGYAIYRDRKRG